MQYDIKESDYTVNMEAINIDVSFTAQAPLEIVIGNGANINVEQAIHYIKSGKAEIEEAVAQGTASFNLNAEAKKAAIDESVAVAADSESNARQSAINALNSETISDTNAVLARQWAIGYPSEPYGNSAKFWADETAAKLIGYATETYVDTGLATKQDVLTSENEGNCINIAMGSPSGLPSEYQELEYLQSSGTQYIDTGIVLNSPATITMVGQFLIGSSSAPVTMWGFLGSNRSLPRWGCSIYSSKWLLDLNNTSLDAPSSDTSMHTFVQNCTSDTYDGLIDGVSIYPTQISISSPDTYTSNTLSVYLFARNNDNTAGNFSTSKIYSYNIVQNGVGVINLIPARRKSDNVLGMYDTVSGNFLTNSGTGTFIAGPDVEAITKISFVNDAGYITGITSSDVTTALGYTPYNSSNPDGYITSADLPTNHVTTDTAQTISANKTFTGVTKFQNGSANGCVVLGANAEGTSVSNNQRKLGRMSFHTFENTVDCAFVSTDSQNDNGVNVNYVEFGGRPGDRTNTSPDVLRFTVVKVHNSTANADKLFGLEMSYSGGANFGVQPKYNNVNLATETYVTSQGYITSSALTPYVLSSSLATVATSGSYDDLSGKPTIPTVNNPTITFTQGGTTKGTITLNQSSNQTIAFDAGGSDVEAFTAAEVLAIWEAN